MAAEQPNAYPPGMNFPQEIEVLPLGCPVWLEGGRGVGAEVTAIAIRSGPSVQYEVVWWDNCTRHKQWVESLEIRTIVEGNRATIGFKAS